MAQPKFRIDWRSLHDDIKFLAKKLPPNSKLWGIPRNGLIIAGLLAHCEDFKIIMLPEPPSGAIIIDDIHDTGQTIRPYTKRGFVVATLYWRQKKESCAPNIWAKTITNNFWLIFPWEKEF